MTYKVSIIVPIYKVEKYLKRCVNSLLNQTYTNLEIILVDDGSPDHCGQIINNYANLDNRVIALHKENGGLSDARNYGMQHVTGDYTIFVDSDDWIELFAIETLIETCKAYKADIVQSAFYYSYDDYLLLDEPYVSQADLPQVLDNQTLMRELVINEKVKNFAWGKLYRTDLIRDLPFKKGVLFEDVFWAHKVMQRVKRYVILNSPMYFYVQREDSIVSTYTLKNLDILRGLKERHVFIEKYYKDLVNESYKILFKTSLIHFNLLLLNQKQDKRGIHRKEIRDFIKNNKRQFRVVIKEEPQLGLQFCLFMIHPYLNVSFLIVKKTLRKLGLLPHPRGLHKIEIMRNKRGDHFNESAS